MEIQNSKQITGAFNCLFAEASAYLSKLGLVALLGRKREVKVSANLSPRLGVQWETKPKLNQDHKILHLQAERK